MKSFKFAAAALALLAGAAGAATWPSQPIKIVVGYPSGGPTDLTARIISTRLQAALGQAVIVENKPGAGSNIATESVAAAQPDGYTLLLAAAPISWNAMLYKNVKWDVQKSFEPVVNIMTAPLILGVSPKLPATNLQQVVALAKKQPGRLSYASTGNGGSQHLAGEQFKQRAGLSILHIPYKGAAGATSDLLGGVVDMAFMTSVSSIPQLKSGNIRPIAVASAKRLPQLPQVPTFAESGYPGFMAESWNGLLAPAKTPPEIVGRINTEVNKILAQPDVREAFSSQGAVVVGGSSADFRKYIAEEVTRWGKLLQSLKITLD